MLSAMNRVVRYLLALGLVVALAALTFAHRLPSHGNDPMLAAYLSVGGSLDDLCGDPLDAQKHGSSGCEACRLVGDLTLPPIALPLRFANVQRADQTLYTPALVAFQARDPGLGARAPPQA